MKNVINYIKEWIIDNNEKRKYLKRIKSEARADGFEEGTKSGIEIGKKEGIKKANLIIAKKMKQEGIAAEIIHKVTGIPINKITML